MGKDKGRIGALEVRLAAAEALVKRVAELEGLNTQLQERVDLLERRQAGTPLWDGPPTPVASGSLKAGKPPLDRGASGVYNLTGDAKEPVGDPEEQQTAIPEAVAGEATDDATLTRKGAPAGTGSSAGANAGVADRVLSPSSQIRSASAYSDDGGDRCENWPLVLCDFFSPPFQFYTAILP